MLEKTLESPWTARRSNQSILKEINPGISLEGMMLKLKLQYFGHLMQRTDSLEKTLMLGGIGDQNCGKETKILYKFFIEVSHLYVLFNIPSMLASSDAPLQVITHPCRSPTSLWSPSVRDSDITLILLFMKMVFTATVF